MFALKDRITTTLICGPCEVTETFMFEGAMHWAKEGNRVIYVTQKPIESLPAEYHDGEKRTMDVFQMIKFVYLPDYKSLMNQLLSELDTFVAPPSALIIEKLENYTKNHSAEEDDAEFLIAETCASIIDAVNSCARVLKKTIHILAGIKLESTNDVYSIYFDNIWHFFTAQKDPNDRESTAITLRKMPSTINDQFFNFYTLEDKTIVLKHVLRYT